MKDIEKIFTGIGGTFLVPAEEIADKLKGIKAFVFDWDGVFNKGDKNETGSGSFNEVDSMGTNMLRFSYWLQNQRVPFTAIISGERNSASFRFCNREHFTNCYYKIIHKVEALDHFCRIHKLNHGEVAYIFDDVPDLSVARTSGLGIFISRKANPLLTKHIVENNFADYITAAESGDFAVREICELLIGLSGSYDETVTHRTDFSEIYRNYLEERNGVTTAFFTRTGDKILEQEPA